MYSSGYSQVSKYSPQARKKMVHRSKGKSCGYYMRIVFFFSSLIQSLIIVSLVLFLIYGKDQDSASSTRIHDLEESFSRLSIENVALRHQRKNLTTFLNTTLTEKARMEWDLARLKHYTNSSLILIQEMQRNLLQCHGELMTCKSQQRMNAYCPSQPIGNNCNCGILMEQLKAKLELEKSNFTQTVQVMRINLEQTAKERDTITLEVIRLRRDKSTHEKEVALFKQKCKDDFTNSLKGISSVTSAFLEKIDSFFPSHHSFQLTCPKQGEYLEQIRTNCSSLSRDVEDRFQRYLNNVGDKVSTIQSESSRLTAENQRLNEDYRWCSQNRTNLIQQNKKEQEKIQLKHDQEKEKHLLDKMKLQGQVEVLENNVKYRMKEVEHLFEQMKLLNMSCWSRGVFGGLPGGSPHQGFNPSGSNPLSGAGSTSLGSPFNRPGQGSSTSFGSGSTGSSFNRPAASNPSLFSTGQSSSSGFGSNKPSTGSGSSSSSGSSYFGSSSSSGSGYNKPSTGSGSSSSSGSSLFGSSSSSGTGYNKPSTGSSSSSSSSSSGSSLFGSSSSSGTGYNKPSTGSGSSSSSGSSLFGSSNSGVGSSKPSTGSGSSSSSGSSLFGSSSSGVGSSKPSSGSGSSSSSGSSLFGSSSSSNKPSSGSSSSSSSGSGTTKTESTGGLFSSYGGRGSSSSSSSSGSAGSSSSSSGLGSNKPSTIGKSPSTAGSSSSGSTGSSGSTSKGSTSSSGGGWFSMGSGSSGASKTGTGTGKSTSSGSGSTFGSGRSSGFTGGPVNVAQHIKDLQRLINPNVPEEKQDLSRMLG